MIPGAREKANRMDFKQSYPEPAQVPLGKKPKVCGSNLAKGIRQISFVSSVEEIPAIVSFRCDYRAQ